MRNITVSVDDETHRLASSDAAAASGGHDDASDAATQRRDRLHAVIDAIAADGGGLLMSENLSRDELHDRDALR